MDTENFETFVNKFFDVENDDDYNYDSSEGGGVLDKIKKGFRRSTGQLVLNIIFFTRNDLKNKKETDTSKVLKTLLGYSTEKDRRGAILDYEQVINKQDLYNVYLYNKAYSLLDGTNYATLVGYTGEAIKRGVKETGESINKSVSEAGEAIKRGVISAKDAPLYGLAITNFKGLSKEGQQRFLEEASRMVGGGIALFSDSEDDYFVGGGPPKTVQLKSKVNLVRLRNKESLLQIINELIVKSGLPLDTVLILDETNKNKIKVDDLYKYEAKDGLMEPRTPL